MSSQRCLHIVIRGKVQGVFFRATTAEKARSLGLSGWVRNLPDGSVEVVVKGDEEKLKELIEFCHKGPPLARVTEVLVQEVEDPKDLPHPFSIRY